MTTASKRPTLQFIPAAGSFKSVELLCHRCGSGLLPDDTFCTTCGAPQLRIEEGAEGVEPFNSAAPRQPGGLAPDPSWKDAILAALVFAVPVGLLSSNLLPFFSSWLCLWVMSGAIAAVNFYRRRSSSALLDTRVGLRIGMVVGIAAAVLASTLDGILMVVQRYVLHNGALPDKEVRAMIEIFNASLAQNPQAEVQFHDFYSALTTPDGRAGLMLFAAFGSSLGIFVFSVIGGALAAKIFTLRKLGVRNP